MPLTIAVDLTPVLPGGDNGGAKIYALELVRGLAATAPQTSFVLLTQAASHEELAALDAANVRRVLTVGDSAASLRPRLARMLGLAMRAVPSRLRGDLGRLAYRVHSLLKRGGSRRVLRDGKVDLLFCPFTAPTFREPGIPSVCTVYDLQYLAYPQFFSIEDRVQRESAFLDACRNATLLAAISDYTREAAMRHGPVDPQRIRTIHLRLARRAAEGDAGELLRRWGLARQRYLIYPANFWSHKNHEMLLVAFAAARARIDGDVKIVLTGAGANRQAAIVEGARRMGLADRVVCTGFLPTDELLRLMANAAGLIFPSLYEGFGLPVTEAMALGVPVACSDATALPEIAGGAALLFDPRVPAQVADAIVALLQDEALRQRLRAAGELRAAHFLDADRMVAEHWDLFRSAVAC